MSLARELDELTQIRTRFDATSRRRRLAILERAANCPIDDAAELIAWHELLLFAAAYPDDQRVGQLVARELDRVAAAAESLGARRGARKRLFNSGIANSRVECQFSSRIIVWLTERFPDDIEIATDDEDSGGNGLETMLHTIVERLEIDGVDDTSVNTAEWLSVARGIEHGPSHKSDLAWVIEHFTRLDLPPPFRDLVFDMFELWVHWDLRGPLASRTFCRLPRGTHWYQQEPLQRAIDLPAVIARPVPPVKPEPVASARELIDVARATLAVRLRETDPVTHANPHDLTFVELGRGIQVLLIGQDPAHRCPLNCYYGYLLARNRVPLAYGGGWMFCDDCEIGLNIFETFRGGESAMVFAQLLRLYHHQFGVRRFTIAPYQIGAGNPEAIRAGAVWFYYRMGFRFADPATHRKAEEEWARVRDDRSYRTPARVLRRLAGMPLALEVGSPDPAAPAVPALPSVTPAAVSFAITRWIGRTFGGDRAAARRWSVDRIRRVAAVDESGWADAEAAAFRDFSLAIAPIADLDDWGRQDLRALVTMMRAKGRRRESEFASRLRDHHRLRAAWASLVDSEDRPD